MSTETAAAATVSRNKEKVYDEASNQFSVMFKQAIQDNSVKKDINDAFNMQKNENILNVIYSRFEHHIETVMKMNDVTAKGDLEAKTIDGIVFNHFITTLENPTSPLSQFIQKILNKHSSDTETPTLFFIVKENLIQYITGNKKSGGGGPLDAFNDAANNFSKGANKFLGKEGTGPNYYTKGEIEKIDAAKTVNASKALNEDVTQQLKIIVSRMKGEIQNRIPDKINKIFDDDTFKTGLEDYTKTIIAKIQDSIENSPFFQTDLFSIVYFYKLMKKIEKDGDDTKIDKINEVLNKLKTGGGGVVPGTAPVSGPGTAPVSGPGTAPVSATGTAPVSATGTAPVSATAAPGAPVPIVETPVPVPTAAAQTPLAAAHGSTTGPSDGSTTGSSVPKQFYEEQQLPKFQSYEKLKGGPPVRPLTRTGGRRTRRLSRGKKRTQRKRHNKKKNTTCRKK